MESETSNAALNTGPMTSNELLFTLTDSAVYLMGFSFVLGSMFTILILLLLDFMRRNSPPED